MQTAPNLDLNGFEIVVNTFVEGYHREISISSIYQPGNPLSPAIRAQPIQYSTSSGTATEAIDYIPVSGTIAPTHLEPVGEITIPIVDDDLNEPDEHFFLQFSNPVNFKWSDFDQTFTITDTLRTPLTNSLPDRVENLQLTGTDPINGYGNQGNNIVIGNQSDNLLEGLEGDDTLKGGNGNDTLFGGAGDDVLVGFGNRGGAGEIDFLTGGPGRDVFVLRHAEPLYSEFVVDYAALTAQQLQFIMPQAQPNRINHFLGALNQAMQAFKISTPARQQAFVAQIAHESGSLLFNSEIWQSTAAQRGYEFPAAKAIELGNLSKGDGYRYRGRGLIQLTGRANYRNVGKALGLNLENNPDLVLHPDVSAMVSAYFWYSRDLNRLADAGEFRKITRRINGGYRGYQARVKFWHRAKQSITLQDNDYAVITDFHPAHDVIQLGGVKSDYLLSWSYELNGALLLYRGEAIAVIQGQSRHLNLNHRYFQFESS